MKIELEISNQLYDRFKKALNINSYIKHSFFHDLQHPFISHSQTNDIFNEIIDEELSEEDKDRITKQKLNKLANILIKNEIERHESHT